MKISYYLPPRILSNSELANQFSDWTEEKIRLKTGISTRHIAECSAEDLAEQAALRLFSSYNIDPSIIDFVLFCSQSPTYRLPSTACLLQHKLKIPTTAGALDYDLGCSGFVYGLAMAKGFLVGGVAKHVLLLTAETYTKYIQSDDRSVRTIFGDGAAATLIEQSDVDDIGEFVLGTDGSGAEKLIVRDEHLFMDGPEIFNFTLDIAPQTIDAVLEKNHLSREDIDLYVFHQANKFMLDTIRKVNGLSKDKFYINMEDIGNTVSSTIPIALKRAENDGVLKSGMCVMLMGFGVGLSWGATIVNYKVG